MRINFRQLPIFEPFFMIGEMIANRGVAVVDQIKNDLEKLRESQVTEYERHLEPKRTIEPGEPFNEVEDFGHTER